MEMTYSESQTSLLPPSYVNLVREKPHGKTGESQHNTDCDATVGVINMYAPNFYIYQPMFKAVLTSWSCTAESSDILQVL